MLLKFKIVLKDYFVMLCVTSHFFSPTFFIYNGQYLKLDRFPRPSNFLQLSLAKLCEASEAWSQAFLTINMLLDRIINCRIWSSVTLSASDQCSLPFLIFLDNLRKEIKVWNYSMNNSIDTFLYSSSLRSCILFSIFLHKRNPPP